MTIKETFEHLIRNASMTNNPELRAILEKPDLSLSEDLPLNLSNLIIAGNLSKESAKENPDIKKHYDASLRHYYYNEWGGELKKALEGAGLEEENIKKVLQEDFKKQLPMALQVLTEVMATKTGTSDKSKEDERASLINELQSKLKLAEKKMKEEFVPKSEIEKLHSQIKSDKIDFQLSNAISKITLGENYKDNEKQIKEFIMHNLKTKCLVDTDEKGTIVLKNPTDPSLLATDEKGSLVTFDDLLMNISLPFVQKTPIKEDKKVEFFSEKLQTGADFNAQQAEKMRQESQD